MINWMNVGDPKITETRLHGTHKANIVYALDVIIDQNSDGVLVCEDAFLGKENVDNAMINQECLNFDDRIFCGVVRVKEFYIGEQIEQEQSRDNETEEPADIYPVEE